MRTLAVVLFALLPFAGCGGICKLLDCTPTPEPTPTPTPPPEKPIPPEAEQCHLMTPPASYDCYDNPPNGESFEEWQPNWGYVCAPVNGSTYRVGTPDKCQQPPPPSEGCSAEQRFPQGVDSQLVSLSHSNRFRGAVNEVMSRLSGCAINTDCPIPYGPDEWMEMVCADLCEFGLYCGRHNDVPGTGATDQISISDVPWCDAAHSNQQIFNFGGNSVRWSSAGEKFNDWVFREGAPACANPNPPPSGGCPDPIPPKVGRWSQKTPNPHGPQGPNRWCFDSSPLTPENGPRWDGVEVTQYCTDTGQTRNPCPVRPEGDPTRLPCERIAVSGEADGEPLWRSDGNITDHPADPGNIFMACSTGTWIEVCAADGTVCARRTFR